MAPKKPARARKVLDLRSRSSYPIGSRIADMGNMDLDREAAAGIPGDRLGMPPTAPAEPTPFHPAVVISIVALVVLAIATFVLCPPGLRRVFGARFGLCSLNPPGSASKAKPTLITNRWDDMRAAGKAGAMLDGWLPPFMPEGATAIRERHDPDTLEGWIAFRFVAGEGVRMAERLIGIPAERIPTITIRGPGEDWWPADLVNRIGKPGCPVFRSPRAPRKTGLVEYVAIDRKSSRAFLWREQQ